MEDLRQQICIENSLINVEFLNNRIGETNTGAYLVSITEIVSDCQQISTGSLLAINNYILGLLWKIRFFSYSTHIAKVKLEDCQLQVATSVLPIFSISVTRELCKISILHKLPNDSLLPSTIFKTKMHRG